MNDIDTGSTLMIVTNVAVRHLASTFSIAPLRHAAPTPSVTSRIPRRPPASMSFQRAAGRCDLGGSSVGPQLHGVGVAVDLPGAYGPEGAVMAEQLGQLGNGLIPDLHGGTGVHDQI